MSKYANGRLHMRGDGGRFRKTTMADMGLGGVCQTCHHLLIQHFDGDPRDQNPDPRRFRYRCFTCEPLTEAELQLQADVEASKPKPKSFGDFFKDIAEREKAQRALSMEDVPPTERAAGA